jgi:hypothetical protein
MLKNSGLHSLYKKMYGLFITLARSFSRRQVRSVNGKTIVSQRATQYIDQILKKLIFPLLPKRLFSKMFRNAVFTEVFANTMFKTSKRNDMFEA